MGSNGIKNAAVRSRVATYASVNNLVVAARSVMRVERSDNRDVHLLVGKGVVEKVSVSTDLEEEHSPTNE